MVLPAASSALARCSCSVAARVDMVLVRFGGVPPDLPGYALIRCGIYTCYGQPDIGCRFHGSEIRDDNSAAGLPSLRRNASRVAPTRTSWAVWIGANQISSGAEPN